MPQEKIFAYPSHVDLLFAGDLSKDFIRHFLPNSNREMGDLSIYQLALTNKKIYNNFFKKLEEIIKEALKLEMPIFQDIHIKRAFLLSAVVFPYYKLKSFFSDPNMAGASSGVIEKKEVITTATISKYYQEFIIPSFDKKTVCMNKLIAELEEKRNKWIENSNAASRLQQAKNLQKELAEYPETSIKLSKSGFRHYVLAFFCSTAYLGESVALAWYLVTNIMHRLRAFHEMDQIENLLEDDYSLDCNNSERSCNFTCGAYNTTNINITAQIERYQSLCEKWKTFETVTLGYVIIGIVAIGILCCAFLGYLGIYWGIFGERDEELGKTVVNTLERIPTIKDKFFSYFASVRNDLSGGQIELPLLEENISVHDAANLLKSIYQSTTPNDPEHIQKITKFNDEVRQIKKNYEELLTTNGKTEITERVKSWDQFFQLQTKISASEKEIHALEETAQKEYGIVHKP